MTEALPIWMNEPTPKPPTLIINAWTSECGACGHGRGGWAASPARDGKPILTPESTECPGCGVHFTDSLNLYTGERKPIQPNKVTPAAFDAPGGLTGGVDSDAPEG